MGWEWVAHAGTAVVGVTGAVTTFAASRSAQRGEERRAARDRANTLEDRHRAEKKDIYVRFLSSAERVSAARTRERHMHDAASALAAAEANTDLGTHFQELHLVGSPEVLGRAGPVIAVSIGREDAIEDGTDPKAALPALVDAMRKDLGAEPVRGAPTSPAP